MRTKSLNIILILFISFSFACSTFKFEGEITAEAITPEISIYNQTNTPIYFHVGDREVMARISFDVSNFSDWPKISSGKIFIVQYDEIVFYDEDTTEAAIYWTTKYGKSGTIYVPL